MPQDIWNMQPQWWEETYFSGASLDVQRRLKPELTTQAEATCIQRLLRLPAQAKVLDVPCGEGRLSLELASRGFCMTGVDFTQRALDTARASAAERQLEIAWEQWDMRNLPWSGAYDGAFCFGGSFGFFDDDGNRSFVTSVYRSLKPGARFLVETDLTETILPRFFPDRSWVQVGETLALNERRWDHQLSRLQVDWTFVRDGVTQKSTISVRIYPYRELCAMFQEAGFEQCEGYDAVTRKPFKLGARVLLLVATKSSNSRDVSSSGQ